MIIIILFSQFSLADSLYENSYYELAQIEYKREFFFCPGLKDNPKKRLNFALSLLNSDDFRGIKELNSMIIDFPDLAPGLNLSMAKYHIKTGNYYQANELLAQSEEKNLLGFVYLLNDRFSDAQNLFIENGNYVLAQEINAYMQKPKKSRKTAALLSFLCPGSGEIYAGNIKGGIMDFLLNFGSGYLIYNAMKQKKYVDAALVFTFLFPRFYLGSIYNAQKSVMQRNEIDRQQWLSQIKDTYFPFKDTVVTDLDLNY